MPDPDPNSGSDSGSTDAGSSSDASPVCEAPAGDQTTSDTSSGPVCSPDGDSAHSSTSSTDSAETSTSSTPGGSSSDAPVCEAPASDQSSSAANSGPVCAPDGDTSDSSSSAPAADSSPTSSATQDGGTENTETDGGTASSDAGATPAASSADAGDPAAAQALQDAGADADQNAGDGEVGDSSSSCSPPGGAPPMEPGALEVTVTNSQDGSVIAGATVSITSGSGSASADTDASGKAVFNPQAPDSYQVTAAKTGFAAPASASNANVPPGSGSSGGTPATAQVQLTPITVTVTFPQPVACPGHPFEMDATGTPSGGTFAWSVSGGGAALTDSGGSNPLTSGAQVYMVSYQPDNTNANIPAQSASVTVTYTVGGGSASTTQTVNVHKIDFVVKHDTVTTTRVAANEMAAGVKVWNDTSVGGAEMSTDPQVQIKLDASCPRKTDCATNHRVGWLQTMVTNDRRRRYNDSEIDDTCPMPIRDVWDPDSLPPFYHAPFVQTFAGDGDKQTAHHEDSPSLPALWADPRGGAPAASSLFQVFFANSFTAWLVVQNIEWSAHDVPGSFVYLRNFSWSVHLDFSIDMTKGVGSRCSPKSAAVHLDQAPQKGKGGSIPTLSAPIFNTTQTQTVNPAPHVP